jgi:hypothetical protein
MRELRTVERGRADRPAQRDRPGNCVMNVTPESFDAKTVTAAENRSAVTPMQALSSLLFHEPWWLSAVTRGEFQEVTVKNGDQVIGRLPFVIARKMRLVTLRMPPFTHVLGPAVDVGKGKAQTQLLKRLSIVRELLDQLPRFDFFKQAVEASTADGLAFQDRGFQVSPQYTFRIDCARDPEAIWQDMHFKVRQHVRRAQEKMTVDTADDPEEFIRFYKANLAKQGRRNYMDFSLFVGVFEAARMRGSGEILRARWPDGRLAAMAYLVWGHGTMYYLLSSRASDAGDNGSINLLIWSAIQRAHARGLVFDLDGVSSSGTARFLSGFGGRLEMRLIIRRAAPVYQTMQYVKRRLIGSQADETHAFT